MLIPEGTYVGRVESAEIKESKKNATLYYGCVCAVTEDQKFTGEDQAVRTTKGTRLPFNGYLTEQAGRRTVQALRDAGCTFPNDDWENYDGIGTRDVLLVVETEEYEFTPPPTPEKPTPSQIKTKRSRVAFVNAIARDTVGEAASAAKKAANKDRMKALIGNVKSGSKATGPDASGNRVDAGGTLRNAKDEEVF